MDETIDEIRQQEAQNQANNTPGTGHDPMNDAGNPGLLNSLPGISRQQVIVLTGIAAIVIAVWLLKQRDAGNTGVSTGNTDADTGNDAAEPEFRQDEKAVVVEDTETGEAFAVPANPDEEIEKDEAILRSGIFKEVGN